MNNKLVAWMSPDGKVSDTEGKLFHIPLYTHPVKELTADEIHEIAKQFLKSYDLECNEGLYGETSNVLVAIEDWYDFAKLILRKAQEK